MDQKSEPSLQFCLDIKIPLVEYIARQFCPLLLIVTGCFFGQSQQFSDFNIRHAKAESARQSAYETFSRLNELYCQLGKTGRASSQWSITLKLLACKTISLVLLKPAIYACPLKNPYLLNFCYHNHNFKNNMMELFAV